MGTIDLNHLAVLVAIADQRGFSAAARELGLPKSTVSRTIAALEQELGVQLLHRTSRKVAASSAGAALIERVRPLLHGLQQAVRGLPERDEQPSGLLRVAATPDFAAAVLAEVVARFVERHPAVQVEMVLGNRQVDLVAERVDVALRILNKPMRDGALIARKLGKISLQVFAAPGYVARRGAPRSPQELAGHRWIGLRGFPALRLRGPGEAAPLPKPHVSGDDMGFVHAAARHGAGLALLPTFLVAPDVAAGALVRVLPRWALLSGDLWLAWPQAQRLPLKVAAFRDFVVAAVTARSLAPQLDAR